MRRIKILIIFIFFFPFVVLVQDPASSQEIKQNQEKKKQEIVTFDQDRTAVIDDEDPLSRVSDIFLRKLHVKTLTPLKKQERIKWSFKMSDTNIFL